MQVAVLPWRYDAEMGTANSLRNTASIMKGLSSKNYKQQMFCLWAIFHFKILHFLVETQ